MTLSNTTLEPGMAPGNHSLSNGGRRASEDLLKRQRIPTTEDFDDDSEDDDESMSPKQKRSGRRKIRIEFIDDRSRRHITFSKRKAGIMKKAYELSTLTGTQVLLLVASETGHVYTFATPKLQPMITKPEGKNLIQACLNAPDTFPDISSTEPPMLYEPPPPPPQAANDNYNKMAESIHQQEVKSTTSSAQYSMNPYYGNYPYFNMNAMSNTTPYIGGYHTQSQQQYPTANQYTGQQHNGVPSHFPMHHGVWSSSSNPSNSSTTPLAVPSTPNLTSRHSIAAFGVNPNNICNQSSMSPNVSYSTSTQISQQQQVPHYQDQILSNMQNMQNVHNIYKQMHPIPQTHMHSQYSNTHDEQNMRPSSP